MSVTADHPRASSPGPDDGAGSLFEDLVEEFTALRTKLAAEAKKRFRIETLGMSPMRNCPPGASKLSDWSRNPNRGCLVKTYCKTL